jgi:hypothetical protein
VARTKRSGPLSFTSPDKGLPAFITASREPAFGWQSNHPLPLP